MISTFNEKRLATGCYLQQYFKLGDLQPADDNYRTVELKLPDNIRIT